MAIGSTPEIGKRFNTGTSNIHYPWVINGELWPLMHGEARIVYIPDREENILPAHSQWEWASIRMKPASPPAHDMVRW
jgi:hypothetical protein